MSIHVKSPEEFSQLIQATKGGAWGSTPAVVDFTATWCGPCKAVAPLYEKMAIEYQGRVKFLKVDVDELQEVAQECGVKAMPTFQSFFNGVKDGEVVGGDPSKLRAMIEGLVSRVGPSEGRKVGGSSEGEGASTSAGADAGSETEAEKIRKARLARFGGA